MRTVISEYPITAGAGRDHLFYFDGCLPKVYLLLPTILYRDWPTYLPSPSHKAKDVCIYCIGTTLLCLIGTLASS